MTSIKGKVLFLVLLYLQNVYSIEETLHLTYAADFGDFSEKDLVSSYSIGDNLTYSYALCDRYEDKPTKECILVDHVIVKKGNSLEHIVRNCTKHITFTGYEVTAERKYALTQLDRDNVVFVVQSAKFNGQHARRRRNYYATPDFKTKYLNANIVNMSTCESRSTVIVAKELVDSESSDQQIETLNIVTEKKAIVHFIFRHDSCGDDHRYVVTYNPHKKTPFSKPDRFLHLFHNPSVEVFPIVSSNSTVIAFAAKTLFHSTGSIVLLNRGGEYVFRDDYSYSRIEIPIRVSNIALSTAYENLGICRQKMNRPSLLCTRYDLEGNVQVESDIILKSKNVKILKMHNLQDGGFVVMLGYPAEGDEKIKLLDILRINADGAFVNSSNVTDLKCSADKLNFNVDFYEKKESGYCYYVSCSSPNLSRDYSVTFYTACQS